ncbi:MAG: hypothetical protein Q9163_005647 [Psora crenata]
MPPRRSSSSSTSSTDGSAYPWILEHLLAYPGTYEIPLRTMYTLNSTSSAQQPSRHSPRADTPSLSSTASSPDGSPQSPEFPLDQPHQLPEPSATDHFKQCLMDYISQLPSQPFSLPPAFITSFVRRVFTEELCLVDFTQALTAMDYLKDLENRRKRELTMALQRLGLDKAVVDQRAGEISRNPRISDWVKSMQDKERKVEALYTQVYIGLRRWYPWQTLINEMRLEPFSKANSLAMLNTLYPPAGVTAPTRQLTAHILSSQRSAFFRYITGVEQNGKGILKNLEHQGQRPGDANGWSVIRNVVDKYLRTANGIIEECLEVTSPSCFALDEETNRRDGRRADSGVGFVTGDRPSTSSSTQSKTNAALLDKPLPLSPPKQEQGQPPIPQTPKKRGTTLEKIAREFRNLRNRNDVKEMSLDNHRANTNLDANRTNRGSSKTRGLRKMKSASSLGGSKDNNHSRSGSDEPMPDFDMDARRRQMIVDAQKEKENRLPHDKKKGGVYLSRGLRKSSEMEL